MIDSLERYLEQFAGDSTELDTPSRDYVKCPTCHGFGSCIGAPLPLTNQIFPARITCPTCRGVGYVRATGERHE